MLARENRLVKPDDFRVTMKMGRKASSDHLVSYVKKDDGSEHTKFGFVVAKSVGGAVKRNLVKRRMREVAREILKEKASGFNIVVRALPGAAEISWPILREEFTTTVFSGVSKTAR